MPAGAERSAPELLLLVAPAAADDDPVLLDGNLDPFIEAYLDYSLGAD